MSKFNAAEPSTLSFAERQEVAKELDRLLAQMASDTLQVHSCWGDMQETARQILSYLTGLNVQNKIPRAWRYDCAEILDHVTSIYNPGCFKNLGIYLVGKISVHRNNLCRIWHETKVLKSTYHQMEEANAKSRNQEAHVRQAEQDCTELSER